MEQPDPSDASSHWPALRVADWTATRDTLHMWLQIVGKIELVSTTLLNHWWNVSYEVSARGLRTRVMHHANDSFDAEFDFVDHELVLRTARGGAARIALRPRTVADFYAEVLAALARLDVECTIDTRPNEVAAAVAFPQDVEHHSYDADAAQTFWRQLTRMEAVFARWRAGFAGKASPVQVFWGSLDLACALYSGRAAPEHGNPPANCPAWVMDEAESRENASAGYWPGGDDEGTFYAYAYPEPEGYRVAPVSVGRYEDSLGEWVLPYREVRTAADPDRTLLTFLTETYAAAADRGGWDRALLDVDPDRLQGRLQQGHDPGS